MKLSLVSLKCVPENDFEKFENLLEKYLNGYKTMAFGLVTLIFMYLSLNVTNGARFSMAGSLAGSLAGSSDSKSNCLIETRLTIFIGWHDGAIEEFPFESVLTQYCRFLKILTRDLCLDIQIFNPLQSSFVKINEENFNTIIESVLEYYRGRIHFNHIAADDIMQFSSEMKNSRTN